MNHDRRDSLRSSLLRRDFPESLRMCVCHAYTRTLITRTYFTIPYGATDAYIPARLQTRPARHLRGNLRRNDCESLHGRKRDDTNINASTGVYYVLKRYLVKAVGLPKGRQPSLCPQVVNAKVQRARDFRKLKIK